ncbi:hypothetical protein ANCDUO_19167 [Ancylostoma duodenale]|uniref:Glycogen debranching enzyme C-terminal domain-containing protein n=1 Tax=Ancylostoma duodenale TaxID=51022 RepID=A0A0C2G117_9BILA|nr:hypothetical protein ANCDUO_19167 [Ancylostoma duodenale]
MVTTTTTMTGMIRKPRRDGTTTKALLLKRLLKVKIPFSQYRFDGTSSKLPVVQEWLWVAGFYLRARLAVGHALGGSHWASAKKEVQSRLGNYYGHIKKSTWSSLPELTNSNGSTCWGSCPAQAWSVGCILEACLDFVDLASAMN